MTQLDDPQTSSGSTTEQVKDKMQEGLSQVQDAAQEAKGQAGSRLREQIDTRSTQFGEQTTSVAQAVRRSGQQLRDENGNDVPARVLEQGAERLERLGGYFSESNADRILRDVEDFGRRQPWLLALGGAVVGLVASRLLKASSQGRYQAQQHRPSPVRPSRASISPPDRGLPTAASVPQSDVPA